MAAMDVLAETESLCPQCLAKIAAQIVTDNEQVYLEKECPHHGHYKTVIWRGAGHYLDWYRPPGPVKEPLRLTSISRGCPYDCGLCPEHRQNTCSVLMEVTHSCNLNCPVCYAASEDRSDFEPDINAIEDMYNTIVKSAGVPCPVQLTGGEPTLRDDLPDIVALGRKKGFSHIQIDTNGIRIAEDMDYLLRLKESGAGVIFLQFDGVTDEVYKRIRGCDLWAMKLQAIENCSQARIGVILVPTLIPGINDSQIGEIIRLAKSWIPTVKGVHFQPISYFGRYPDNPGDEERITIAEILTALRDQTEGELKLGSFVPPGCEDPHCSFSSFYVLAEDGELLPTTTFDPSRNSALGFDWKRRPIAEHCRSFLEQKWRFPEQEIEQFGEAGCSGPMCKSWLGFYQRAQIHYLTISGMAFQDVWSLDLKRLKRCCVHVVARDKKIVPFCAFYLTSIEGKRLYANAR